MEYYAYLTQGGDGAKGAYGQPLTPAQVMSFVPANKSPGYYAIALKNTDKKVTITSFNCLASISLQNSAGLYVGPKSIFYYLIDESGQINQSYTVSLNANRDEFASVAVPSLIIPPGFGYAVSFYTWGDGVQLPDNVQVKSAGVGFIGVSTRVCGCKYTDNVTCGQNIIDCDNTKKQCSGSCPSGQNCNEIDKDTYECASPGQECDCKTKKADGTCAEYDCSKVTECGKCGGCPGTCDDGYTCKQDAKFGYYFCDKTAPPPPSPPPPSPPSGSGGSSKSKKNTIIIISSVFGGLILLAIIIVLYLKFKQNDAVY